MRHGYIILAAVLLWPVGVRAQEYLCDTRTGSKCLPVAEHIRQPLRFDTDGRTINGSKPIESIPLCDARELDTLRAENERLRQALTWIAHTYAHQGMKPLPAIDYQDHARAALSQKDEPR